MSDTTPTPHLGRLPFWIADAVLLTTAGALVYVGARPMKVWEILAVVLCAVFGAWICVLPELKQYEAAVKLAETDRLADTSAKLSQLDVLADRIGGATGQWQGVQDRAAKTAELAGGIVDRLAREAEAFASAVSRTADTEKQSLKLEIEKLRRAEGEWLQAIGRIMDHIFALHVAAVRSAQPGVAQQIDRFHGACREALRRVGFVPIVAAPDEAFDPRRHQTPDGSRPADGSRIGETVAPGFLYQGVLLRPIVVQVADARLAQPRATEEGATGDSTSNREPDLFETTGSGTEGGAGNASEPSPADTPEGGA